MINGHFLWGKGRKQYNFRIYVQKQNCYSLWSIHLQKFTDFCSKSECATPTSRVTTGYPLDNICACPIFPFFSVWKVQNWILLLVQLVLILLVVKIKLFIIFIAHLGFCFSETDTICISVLFSPKGNDFFLVNL